jgi:hypothetical protein
MGAEQVFNVLTEFRFDIGHAVADSKTLQTHVERLSNAADSALTSFQRLSMGIVAHMGLGSGGILGAFGAAIQASDKFTQSQLSLSNIMMSNVGSALSFEDAMTSSAAVMEEIRKKAAHFALPAGEMVNMTKLVGANLLNHGQDDTSFSKSIDLSRQFLKSAPILGIDPGLATGQLMDTIGGRANGGDTLYQRLTSETKAMKPFAGNTQAFNALTPEKRLKTLTEALAQFSSNTKVVEANARTLTSEMRRLSEAIKGPFSVLKPIGDALLKAILPALHKVNEYLNGEGRMIGLRLGQMINGFVKDVPHAIAVFMQLRSLQSDLSSASKIMSIIGALIGLHHALAFLGIKIPIVSGALRLFSMAINYLEKDILKATKTSLMATFLPKGGTISKVGAWLNAGAVTGPMMTFGRYFFMFSNGLVTVASRIFLPLMLLVGVFQLLSRAAGYAKMFAAERLSAAMPKITEAFAKFGIILGMLDKGFDAIARSIGFFLDPSFFLGFIDVFQVLGSVLNFVADATVMAIAGFQGLMFAIMQTIINIANDLASFLPGMGKNTFGPTVDVGEAFNAGIDDILEKYFKGLEDGKTAVQMQTNIYGGIKIENQFKENLEPDRIAISLKDQLMKTVQNPTQGKGKSLAYGGA